MIALYGPWFLVVVAVVGFALIFRMIRDQDGPRIVDPSQPVQRRRVPMPWETDPAPSVPPEPLPPVGSATSCAKCGAGFPEHMAVRWLAYDPMFNYCRGPGYGRRWSWEHLECRCLRCGYVWAEAPEKADPAGGAS